MWPLPKPPFTARKQTYNRADHIQQHACPGRTLPKVQGHLEAQDGQVLQLFARYKGTLRVVGHAPCETWRSPSGQRFFRTSFTLTAFAA